MDLPLNIGLAQINPIVGDFAYNSAKILESWQALDERGADVILFPELILCGYPPEDLVLKPFFIDQARAAIEEICEKSKAFKAAALIGCPWREDGKTYNAVHLVANGDIVATRYKYHLPNYGVFDEHRVFSAGPLPSPIEYKGHKLGVMICEDMWYADVAENLKAQGAEVLLIPNGSPFENDKQSVRLDHAYDRATETELPLVYVNQVGGQDELVFDGHSFVMDGFGQIAFEAPAFEESLALTDDDGSAPLHEEALLYKALVTGLRDYVHKNGFPGVIIGMSGGIDSALSAAIAADALGGENVRCVMMPSRYTNQDSLEDALACSEALGVNYETVPIDEPMSAFNTLIPGLEGIAAENIQPRIRGSILMAMSNQSGHMLLSTGNKSEMAVGYATLYGDMCGGFNALKDLYKMQVYALANWRNTVSQVIPERIITKAPTAELKDNQTDQDSLPEYEQLDDILQCLIEHEMSISEIAERGHDIDTIQRVWKMLDRAEYKRRQAPPGIKITSRAFGRDRRYPITNRFFKV